LFPAWLAITEAVPAPSIVTFVPLSDIFVEEELKLTARPEEEVAPNPIVRPLLYVAPLSAGKEIALLALEIMIVFVTGSASRKLLLPDWFAITEAVPAPNIVRFVPLSEIFVEEELKLTARPEEEVAPNPMVRPLL
jgi:hypothetical protein